MPGTDEDAADEETDEEDRDSVPLSDLREDVIDASGANGDPDSSGEEDGRDSSGPDADPDSSAGKGETDSASRTASDPAAEGTREAGAAREEGERESIPLSELRDEVESGSGSRESDSSDAHLFHEERVDEVESEAVWADLLMGSGDTEGLFEPVDFEDDLGQTYQVVPKTLCHRCEFFGEPPTLHCTHDGTTIHETVDMDHYRVSACPMVDEGDDEERDGPGE